MRRRCGSGGASGPGGGARCCRCVVAGALLLLSPCAKPITVKLDIPCRQTKTYEDETRHRSTTMKLDKNDEAGRGGGESRTRTEETSPPCHKRHFNSGGSHFKCLKASGLSTVTSAKNVVANRRGQGSCKSPTANWDKKRRSRHTQSLSLRHKTLTPATFPQSLN